MRIVRLAQTTSTQEVARSLPTGTAVVTDVQTAGRGRLDRTWRTPPGTALLATFVLPARPLALFCAGVAAAEACGPEVRIKWPNDLLLGGAKLAGILAEQHGDRCLLGTGINLTWAPPGAAMLGADRAQLLDRLIASLDAWWPAPDADVLQAWRRRSDTLGRAVRAQLPAEIVEGVAEEIDADGALLVAGRRLVVGDIVHLRPAETTAPADRSRRA